MFDFRFFPGVDFSKINLDWIMRKIGLLEAGQGAVEEAAEQATAAAETATEAAETATEAAEDAVEQIQTVVGTANEAKQIAQGANTTAGNALTQADTAREETADLYSKFPVSVANGGTGANNAADARTNLGLGFDDGANYYKLDNGILICWGETAYTSVVGGTYVDASITFPVPFIAIPQMIIGAVSDSDGVDTGYELIARYSRSLTGAVVRFYKAEGVGRAPAASWIAIGRWK